MWNSAGKREHRHAAGGAGAGGSDIAENAMVLLSKYADLLVVHFRSRGTIRCQRNPQKVDPRS